MRLYLALLTAIACSLASASSAELSPKQIFQKWSKAVVTVKAGERSGTGFILRNGSLLFTAYHVLDGAATASVVFPNGTEKQILGVLAADKAKDYAVLWVATSVNGPDLGNYAALQVGEPVTVIGSPLGLSQTVTTGIVSAKRKVGGADLLQLSAGISPGSSGSPVFNSKGEVVGMVVASLSEGQLLNFAISAKDLKDYKWVPLKAVFRDKGDLGVAERGDPTAAVRAVEKLGGRVKVDETRPGKPVVEVDLTGTRVTDAGLAHLKGLKSLQKLDLWNTQVTDAGLVHLKGLKSLQELELFGTQVTDAGLVHLKELKSLQWLGLSFTQVTDGGVEELRLARPGLQIFR